MIGALLTTARPAQAKYDPCRSVGELWIAPSGPVPRNAKVWLPDNEATAVAFRVRGPGVDRIVRMAPGGPQYLDLGWLGPGATYQITVPGWGDLDVGSFTTTAREDHVPPPAPVIRSLAIGHLSDDQHDADDDVQVARGEIGAWPTRQRANDFAVDLDLSDDTVFLDVVVRSEGAVDHQVIWREDLRTLGHSGCGHDAHVAAGTEVCLSIRAFDLAGNLGAPATRCTVVVDRPGDSRREVEPLRAFPPAPAPLPRGLPPWIAAAIAAALASWVASRGARGLHTTMVIGEIARPSAAKLRCRSETVTSDMLRAEGIELCKNVKL